jgi:hypothetical protein
MFCINRSKSGVKINGVDSPFSILDIQQKQNVKQSEPQSSLSEPNVQASHRAPCFEGSTSHKSRRLTTLQSYCDNFLVLWSAAWDLLGASTKDTKSDVCSMRLALLPVESPTLLQLRGVRSDERCP